MSSPLLIFLGFKENDYFAKIDMNYIVMYR